MLQSLDLHDSRSAMITFLGRSNRVCTKAQPIMLYKTHDGLRWVNIFSHFAGWVGQLCPSLVALTRFLLGKGWPRTSKSELMGSCWFTVKILLSLIHDISDNRGYHSGIFAILSIFSLLAEGIKERKSACAIISRFNMNISPPIKGLTGDGSDDDNDDDSDHCDCL